MDLLYLQYKRTQSESANTAGLRSWESPRSPMQLGSYFTKYAYVDIHKKKFMEDGKPYIIVLHQAMLWSTL